MRDHTLRLRPQPSLKDGKLTDLFTCIIIARAQLNNCSSTLSVLAASNHVRSIARSAIGPRLTLRTALVNTRTAPPAAQKGGSVYIVDKTEANTAQIAGHSA